MQEIHRPMLNFMDCPATRSTECHLVICMTVLDECFSHNYTFPHRKEVAGFTQAPDWCSPAFWENPDPFWRLMPTSSLSRSWRNFHVNSFAQTSSFRKHHFCSSCRDWLLRLSVWKRQDVKPPHSPSSQHSSVANFWTLSKAVLSANQCVLALAKWEKQS